MNSPVVCYSEGFFLGGRGARRRRDSCHHAYGAKFPGYRQSPLLPKIFAIKTIKRVNGDNLQVAKLAFIYKVDCTVQKV